MADALAIEPADWRAVYCRFCVETNAAPGCPLRALAGSAGQTRPAARIGLTDWAGLVAATGSGDSSQAVHNYCLGKLRAGGAASAKHQCANDHRTSTTATPANRRVDAAEFEPYLCRPADLDAAPLGAGCSDCPPRNDRAGMVE